MKRIILAFSLFFCFTVLANPAQTMGGNEVGNGGDVVVCRDKDEIKSIQLLDFYEVKTKDKKEISSSLKDEDSILREIISKVGEVDPKRGELFRKKAQTFLKEVHFMENVKLSDIPDSFHLVLPQEKNCKLEQIAILDKNQTDPGKKFVINKNLWDELDPLNKAGLVMHEIVYEYFGSLGERNSIKVRAYNASLFGTYTSDEYWLFLKNLRLPIYR